MLLGLLRVQRRTFFEGVGKWRGWLFLGFRFFLRRGLFFLGGRFGKHVGFGLHFGLHCLRFFLRQRIGGWRGKSGRRFCFRRFGKVGGVGSGSRPRCRRWDGTGPGERRRLGGSLFEVGAGGRCKNHGEEQR